MSISYVNWLIETQNQYDIYSKTHQTMYSGFNICFEGPEALI
jgi:hypothetical protein